MQAHWFGILSFIQERQGGKTADWLLISRVLALSADQSKAAQVN